MIELVLIGGGGHARACIDLIQASDQFQILGILDRSELVGTDVLGIPVIGTDEDLPVLVKKNLSFLITLGQIKTPDLRIRIYKRIKELGGLLSTVIATSAHVSPFAQIGEGVAAICRQHLGQARLGEKIRLGRQNVGRCLALVKAAHHRRDALRDQRLGVHLKPAAPVAKLGIQPQPRHAAGQQATVGLEARVHRRPLLRPREEIHKTLLGVGQAHQVVDQGLAFFGKGHGAAQNKWAVRKRRNESPLRTAEPRASFFRTCGRVPPR